MPHGKPCRKPSSSPRKSSEKDKKFYGAKLHGEASHPARDPACVHRFHCKRLSAEEFPNRPITWVVPFAPGGITDTTSRIVAEEMSKTLGQSVLIDNRGGGGGTVGTEQVARAKPDGYTMIYGTQGTMAAYVSLRKNLPYDPLTSFLPVHLVGESPNLFVAYRGRAVQFGAGVHRLRQAESGQGDVLLLGGRHRDASGR